MYSDFEHLMDPSRNHRPYRVLISQMDPPAIPFLALILKGISLKKFVISINWLPTLFDVAIADLKDVKTK